MVTLFDMFLSSPVIFDLAEGTQGAHVQYIHSLKQRWDQTQAGRRTNMRSSLVGLVWTTGTGERRGRAVGEVYVHVLLLPFPPDLPVTFDRCSTRLSGSSEVLGSAVVQRRYL